MYLQGTKWKPEEDALIMVGINDALERLVEAFDEAGHTRTRDAIRKRRERLAKVAGFNRKYSNSAKNIHSQKDISVNAKNEVTETYESDKAEIFSKGTVIKSLKDALKSAKVDLLVWDVERHVVNTWTTSAKNNDGELEQITNYQVKVWLKKKDASLSGIPVALEELLRTIKSPKREPIAAKKLVNPHLLEISIVDHHFGKLAWHGETNNDYDLKIAERVYANAVDVLLSRGKGFDVEQILFPVGSDFLHINGLAPLTANGTHQDVDGRMPKIFDVALASVIRAIDRCAAVAPVHVLWVPGNHDRETSYYLLKVLEAWFRNDKRVTVDASTTSRKYYKYGTNLLGFTHGDEERKGSLPLIMASERPQDWANTTFREWHLGHLHKSKETKYVTADSEGAVRERILPSLCGTDAWHYRKGYVQGNKAAEAYLYSKEHGYSGHFSVNADK